MPSSYYKSDFRGTITGGGATLPAISTDLDSVRAFQFEAQFTGFPGGNNKTATLAAKKVTAIAMTNEPIVVDRVNDKVYYPGKTTPEEVTITFDNIYKDKIHRALWDWFTGTYNPDTGNLGATIKKAKLTLVMLNNTLSPVGQAVMIGVFPVKYSLSEFQYSENQFHTIDVTFRFDYMDI